MRDFLLIFPRYCTVPVYLVYLDRGPFAHGYGTMEGYQSVPRAELYALMAIVLYTAALPTPAPLTIISDNKAVVDGFNAGNRPSHSNMGDLWERFWAIYAIAQGAGWTFQVQKIKSHTLEKDLNEYPLDLDEMPMEHRIGNSRADRWADYAASLVACGEDHRNNVAFQDAGGWLIRKRFICICQHFLTKGPHVTPPRRREGLTGVKC